MTLEQIHAEVEKLRNREYLWRVVAIFLIAICILAVRDARHENKRAIAYRAIAYELALSFPSTPDGDEDTNNALQLLAQTDEHD